MRRILLALSTVALLTLSLSAQVVMLSDEQNSYAPGDKIPACHRLYVRVSAIPTPPDGRAEVLFLYPNGTLNNAVFGVTYRDTWSLVTGYGAAEVIVRVYDKNGRMVSHSHYNFRFV